MERKPTRRFGTALQKALLKAGLKRGGRDGPKSAAPTASQSQTAAGGASSSAHNVGARHSAATQTDITPSVRVQGDERTLVIGFDFGTSCSKVVIRDPAANVAYAVPFGRIASRANPYLLPTNLYLQEDGRLNLEPSEIRLTDIKRQVMSNPDGDFVQEPPAQTPLRPLDVMTGYIAAALRLIRPWFLDSQEEIYRHSKVLWQLNVGIPCNAGDYKRQEVSFYRAAYAAWLVSVDPRGVTTDSILDARRRCRALPPDGSVDCLARNNDHEIHPADVSAVPEVIAEVLGYANSPMRRSCMHLLVDVGAGTLDVATFIVHTRDGEDVYPLLVTDVCEFGAHVLHHRRCSSIRKIVQDKLAGLVDNTDPGIPLPETSAYELTVAPDSLIHLDRDFGRECQNRIGRVLHKTKQKRNPLAYVYEQGMPVFLCGGGSPIELYKTAIEGARMTVHGIGPFEILRLPKPEDLRAPEVLPQEFHRLAVAYGLSFQRIDMGQFIDPEDIPDMEPPGHADYTNRYIGPEQM